MSMTRAKIEATKALAEKVIRDCDALTAKLDSSLERYNWATSTTETCPPSSYDSPYSTVEGGALRRSSMDLTRQLAELRK